MGRRAAYPAAAGRAAFGDAALARGDFWAFAPLGLCLPVGGGLLACSLGLSTGDHPVWTILLIFTLTLPVLSASMSRLHDAGRDEGEDMAPIGLLTVWTLMVLAVANGWAVVAFVFGVWSGAVTLDIATMLTCVVGTAFIVVLLALPFIVLGMIARIAGLCALRTISPAESTR